VCRLCVQRGQSSLHAAAIAGHVNVIKALLNKGAHIEARTKVIHSHAYMVVDAHT